MSQISKCPRVTVVLSYWEASGEVSKLSYKSLLFDSSRRSYCILFKSYFRSVIITVKIQRVYTTYMVCGHVIEMMVIMSNSYAMVTIDEMI